MTLLQKQRHRNKRYQGRRARRRVYRKQRQRTGLFVFVGLIILTLVCLSFLFPSLMTESNSDVVQQAEEPTVVQEVPETTSADEASDTDKISDTDKEKTSEEEATPVPPDDPTMFLTIPKLGVAGALVTDGDGGLELGAEHLPGTGYPWLPGSNTYIAGHRLGFPGTGSDHVFFGLPSLGQGDEIILTDSNGKAYTYRVSEILQVDPNDLSVTAPVGGDVVSLQTCIENYGDFVTLGPDWNVRLIVRGTRVA